MAKEDWIEQDDGQGNVYYYNEVTGETSWTLPDDGGADGATASGESDQAWVEQDDGQGFGGTDSGKAAASSEEKGEETSGVTETSDASEGPKWSKVLDASSGEYYFYNNFTGDTQWEQPADFVEEKLPTSVSAAAKMKMPPKLIELLAALKMQAIFRAKQGRQESRIARANKQVDEEIEKGNTAKWTEVMDPASGYPYYFNCETEETTWEKPPDFDGVSNFPDNEATQGEEDETEMPEWVRIYDPNSVAYYYFNNFTGETTWDEPDGYEEPKDKSNLAVLMNPEVRAALRIQGVYRKKQARAVMRAKKAAMQLSEDGGPADGQVWSPILDEESGCYYYYNNETEEVTWDKPEELMDETEKAAAIAEKEMENEELPTWVKVYDPSSVAYYYYNNYTGECVWEVPADYIEPKDKTILASLMKPELKAALLIQGVYRKKQARAVMRAKKAAYNIEQEGGHAGDSPWVATLDEDSGYHYYYNVETEEVTWDKPQELMTEEEKAAAAEAGDTDEQEYPTWVRVYDPSSVAYYYWNNYTGDCVWDEPEDYVEPKDKSILARMMKPELKAALLIQGIYRKKQARAVMRAKKAAKELEGAAAPVEGTVWVVTHDEASGYDYYYNIETEEVTWDKPEELMSEEEKQEWAAAAEGGEGDQEWPTWVRVYDPNAVAYYYWNQYTQEVTWEEPADYVPPKDKSILADFMNPELRAVLKIQGVYRAKQARKVKRAKEAAAAYNAEHGTNYSSEGNGEVAGPVWQAVPDEASGMEYYWNCVTGEVTWEKPIELMEGEEKKEAMAKNMLSNFRADAVQKSVQDNISRYLEENQAAAAGGVEWVAVYDPNSEAMYYWNQVTQETVWTQPENFVEAADHGLMKAVLKIQAVYRAKKARGEIRVLRGELAAANSTDENPWIEVQDPASGSTYYYHRDTKEVSWTKPSADGEVSEDSKWVAQIDPNSGKTYWYHMETKETTWKNPLEKDVEVGLSSVELLKRKKEALKARMSSEYDEEAELERQMEEKRKKQAAEEKEKRRLRREAEEKARKEAEEEAKRLKEERKRKAAEEKARRRAERKKKREEAKAKRLKWKKKQLEKAALISKKKREEERLAEQERLRKIRELDEKKRERKRQDELEAKKQYRIDLKNWKLTYKSACKKFNDKLWQRKKIVNKRKKERAKELLDIAAEAAKHKEEIWDACCIKDIWTVVRAGANINRYHEIMQAHPEDHYHVNDQNTLGETLLHIACAHGRADHVQEILKMEPHVHKHCSVFLRMTPLHEAARHGDAQIIKLLLDAGADIRATDLHDDLPLHWAVRNGHRAAAMELLAADPEMETLEFPNIRGRIPRDLAKRDPVIRLMNDYHEKLELKKKADRREQDKKDLEAKLYRKKKNRAMKLLHGRIKMTKKFGGANLSEFRDDLKKSKPKKSPLPAPQVQKMRPGGKLFTKLRKTNRVLRSLKKREVKK
eukprot:g3113.t1